MILIEEDASSGYKEYVGASVRELNRIACWKTEVDLNLLVETAFGLIELSRQTQHYTNQGFSVERVLNNAIEGVKVREIWFEYNRKAVLKPLWLSEKTLPTGKFSQQLNEEFIADEFVRQYKK